MNIAIVGMGLIGGSFYKASLKAGHEAVGLHHGDGPAALADADLVAVCLPPEAIVPWIRAHAADFRPGAVVFDICGVKSRILDEMRGCPRGGWHFVGGHPMAGREVSGFANALADLFVGASMVLTPPEGTPAEVVARLRDYFASVGFARTVVTTPAHHDEMIAFTSQLCHLLSSAYVREPLARGHVGYSAGSFRDMARVGAPDPDIWTELFLSNRGALLPVLERYIARLDDFRAALAANDRGRLHQALAEGVAAKAQFGGGLE